MIKNYILIGIRSLLRKKTFSIINILGFSLGLSCALLIMAFVWDEINYDSYHKDGESVFRIALERHFPDRSNVYATTPPPLGPTLYQDFPEVTSYSRVFDPGNQARVEIDDKIYYEDRFYAADSSFFEIFGVEFISGNPKEALKAPNSIVLSESTALKYFGSLDILNQSIEVGNGNDFNITAIVKDVPKRSHFKFDLLASLESYPISRSTFWGSYSIHTYVRLSNPTLGPLLIEKIPPLLEQRMGPQVESILNKTYQEYVDAGNIHDFFLQPISTIHLRSQFTNEFEPNGDFGNVVLFLVIAILILIIAGFNFTNLATAYAVKRSKEVGVRKVLGSSKGQLRAQFLTESILVTTIAVCLSLAIVYYALPTFNQMAGKEIAFGDFHAGYVALFLAALTVLVGLASGMYPAFFITTFNIVQIFKGGVKLSHKKFGLRNFLVTIQFAASIFMVLATVFIVLQLNYMQNKKLGFDKEQILLLEVGNNLSSDYETFMDELKNEPYINDVSSSFHVPGRNAGGGTFQAIGVPATERFLFQLFVTDYNFQNAYGLKLENGRYFDDDLSTDTATVVINESTASMVGWTNEEAIGKQIRITGQQFDHKIIGVVEDFHFTSLREPISPMVFIGIPSENLNTVQPSVMSIKLNPEIDIRQSMQNLERKWVEAVPEEDFRYAFMDSEFDRLYENEIRFASVFKSFSILAILISLVGVIGLSIYVAAERTKEIGIRKVLGATMSQVMLLLSKDFMILIAVANLVIWPVTYFLLQNWIASYAYAISINVLYFVLVGAVFTFVVLTTISIVTYRAANANPVDAIGYE